MSAVMCMISVGTLSLVHYECDVYDQCWYIIPSGIVSAVMLKVLVHCECRRVYDQCWYIIPCTI